MTEDETLTLTVDAGDGAVMTAERRNVDRSLEWIMRYGDPCSVRYSVASVLASYKYLLSDEISATEARRRLALLRQEGGEYEDSAVRAAFAAGLKAGRQRGPIMSDETLERMRLSQRVRRNKEKDFASSAVLALIPSRPSQESYLCDCPTVCVPPCSDAAARSIRDEIKEALK